MADPLGSRSASRAASARADPAPPAERAARVAAIRAHVLPLIRALAGAQRAGGLPVLMAVLGPYTFTYRRPLVGERAKPHRLEIRRRRRLMVLEWNEDDLRVLVFRRGAWEDEVLHLQAGTAAGG